MEIFDASFDYPFAILRLIQEMCSRKARDRCLEERLGMTIKELQKLKRRDLLQLLVEQSREALNLQTEQEEKEEETARLEKSNVRLKAKIEAKDIQIERLMGRLNGKRQRIRELETEIEIWHSNRQAGLDNAETVAEAALKLSGIVEAAQRAADQYLYNIRQRCGREAAMCGRPEIGSIGGSEG